MDFYFRQSHSDCPRLLAAAFVQGDIGLPLVTLLVVPFRLAMPDEKY